MTAVSVSHQRLAAVAGVTAALLAASCCLLPLILIGLGLAGAGVMMMTMRYEWITLPLSLVALAGAYGLYVSHRRRCRAAACEFVGQRTIQTVMVVSVVVEVIALLLRVFPAFTASLIEKLI